MPGTHESSFDPMKASGRQPVGALDTWRINLAQSWEIHFWIQQLSCTEEELREAVGRVGPLAGDVRADLEAHRR